MKIKNYVKINGEYVPTSEMTDEQMKKVSRKILDRFAEKMGYEKTVKKMNRCSRPGPIK